MVLFPAMAQNRFSAGDQQTDVQYPVVGSTLDVHVMPSGLVVAKLLVVVFA